MIKSVNIFQNSKELHKIRIEFWASGLVKMIEVDKLSFKHIEEINKFILGE